MDDPQLHDEQELAGRRSIGRKFAAGLSIVIAGFAIYVLAHTFQSVNLGDLASAIAATSADQIMAAGCLTFLSFLALTGYDGVALHQIRARVGYPTTALASFTSYAIAFTLGFPLITGGTVRYWVYSRVGLTGSKVASLTVIAGVTFWFGLIVVIGAGLTFRPGAMSVINHIEPVLNMLMGIFVLGTFFAYLAWVTARRRQVRIQGFCLELPGFGLTLAQCTLGIIDQCSAAGVLYSLLPHHAGVDFFTFAATYAFACVLGVASSAPGGIGVFEAVMLKAVPISSQESLLAALVLFRVIYYLVPFFLALALLGASEVFRRWKVSRAAMRQSGGEP